MKKRKRVVSGMLLSLFISFSTVAAQGFQTEEPTLTGKRALLAEKAQLFVEWSKRMISFTSTLDQRNG